MRQEKKMNNTDTWAQCYKTFYGRNLQIFIMSMSLASLSSLV